MMSKLYGYLAAAGGLLLALLAALGMARRSGVRAEQAAETEKALQQGKESSAIDDKVRASTDDDLAARMRRFTRD